MPTRILPYVGAVEVPVPPLPIPRKPVTWVARFTRPPRLESERQVLPIAKQPLLIVMPVVWVEVADPVWAKFKTERPPLKVEVAVVVAFTVPKKAALARVTEAKELVEVALVVVEKVVVSPPLNCVSEVVELFVPENGYCARILVKVGRQRPLIAIQPVFPAAVVRLIPPPWKVEVAVVEA